jgi:hypothetical protein
MRWGRETIVLLHHGFSASRCEGFSSAVRQREVVYDRRGLGQCFIQLNQVCGRPFREGVKDGVLAEWNRSLSSGGQCEGGVVAGVCRVAPEKVRAVTRAHCYSTVPMTELNHAKFTKSFDQLDLNCGRDT